MSCAGAPGPTVVERFPVEPEASRWSAAGRCAVSRPPRRGGRMQASLAAWTSLDPDRGFRSDVSRGLRLRNDPIRECCAPRSKRSARRAPAGTGRRGRSTEVNYEFGAADAGDDPLVRVAIRPRRQDTLLVNGSIVLTRDEADLVRLEGTLVRAAVVLDAARRGGPAVPRGVAGSSGAGVDGLDGRRAGRSPAGPRSRWTTSPRASTGST